MKVITGRFGRTMTYAGPLPTHGVYQLRHWELLGERAPEISLHWIFESAAGAAAREELQGRRCVVVCFDYSLKEGEQASA